MSSNFLTTHFFTSEASSSVNCMMRTDGLYPPNLQSCPVSFVSLSGTGVSLLDIHKRTDTAQAQAQTAVLQA